MQEQNFEKQVQDTLSELSLTPSVPVWQKVEQEIRQKKKRRRVVVLWLLAALLTGGGAVGILYLTSGRTGLPTTQAMSTNSQSSHPTHSPHTSTTQKTTGAPTVTNGHTVVTTNSVIPNSHTPALNIPATASPETGVAKTPLEEKPILTNSKAAGKGKRNINRTGLASKAATNKNAKRITETHTIPTEELEVAVTINPSEDKETSIIIADAVTTTTDTATTSLSVTAIESPLEEATATDSTQKAKAQKKIAKWSWAAQAGYGVSSLQEDFLSKGIGVPVAYSASPGNSGFPTNPPPSFSSAAGIEKGAAFHIGLSGKRDLNQRLALTAGLQYRYFSTKNKVGQPIQRDTIIVRTETMDNVVLNQFYRASQSGPLKEYTNKYHFIELPVGIEWQVHRRLPFHLQTGVSLSYLVGTNALVFDPTAGIYYKNEELFRKTQLHVFSGLTYRVWKHKRYGIHVGPYLQFGISGLQKESTNQHLFATGLKTQVSF